LKHLQLFRLFLAFAFTVLSLHTVKAQFKNLENTVAYELLKEETEFTFFSFGVHAFSMELNKYNLPITFGIEGLFSTEMAYAGMGIKVGQGLIDSPNQYQFQGSVYGRVQLVQSTILYGGFHFVNWNKKENVKITLSKGSNSSTYTKIKANVKTSLGGDFGYENGITPYTGPNTYFIGVGNGFSSPIQVPMRGSTGYTTYNFGILQVGLGLTKQHFTEIKTDRYGLKSEHRFLRYYVHLSIPVKAELENVDKPNYNTFDLNGHTEISKVGYNLGVMSTGIKGFDTIGFAEIGYFPGPRMNYINNLYFKFGVGFSMTKLFGF
jgi:hypothetical protein